MKWYALSQIKRWLSVRLHLLSIECRHAYVDGTSYSSVITCLKLCHMHLQETIPSMETGDLCADTAPTPKSKACQDPGAVTDTCGVTTYQDTPYSNYMSYTGTLNNHYLLSCVFVISSRPSGRWQKDRLKERMIHRTGVDYMALLSVYCTMLEKWR